MSEKDSIVQTIHTLSQQHQKGDFTDEVYLEKVRDVMQQSLAGSVRFTSAELKNLLQDFRNTILKIKDNAALMQDYYTILSNQAMMAGRLGEELYFAQKINEYAVNDKNRPSIISLTFLTEYYMANQSGENLSAVFKDYNSFIYELPEFVKKGEYSAKETKLISNFYCNLGTGFFQTKDTTSGNEILILFKQLRDGAKVKFKENNDVTIRLWYAELLTLYEKHLVLNQQQSVWQIIQKLSALTTDERTPSYLINFIERTVLDKKIIYFLEHKNVDSTNLFLTKFQQLNGPNTMPYNLYMMTKYKARALYNEGKYLQSLDTLKKAIEIIEEIRGKRDVEVDEMMYAKALAEDQELKLSDLHQKQQASNQKLLTGYIAIGLLLIGAVLTIIFIRNNQKKKFLEYKLNLARNIHDEANPAFLYAKTLARFERLKQGLENKTELENHIDDTMELLRSLSHDLLSDRQHTIKELINESDNFLNKLSRVNDFQYSISKNIDGSIFLSRFQFIQLQNILKECVSNSLKHATFKKIRLRFSQKENKIFITYNDDGPGWEESENKSGIGLKNMEERAAKMNADLIISNHYPQGYTIEISFKKQ